MSYRHIQLGNTKIYYQLDELFCRVQAEQFLRIFARTLPYPLGRANGMLLQCGERFDMMTEFAGPIFTSNEVDPIVLLERFVISTSENTKLDPYDAYVVHRQSRDFVVSYDQRRGSFLFSTSITLTGEDKKYTHVLETALFNEIDFSEVFVEYMESLREFVEFIYDACGVDAKQLVNPYIVYDDLLQNDVPQNQHTPSQPSAEKLAPLQCKILPFVRPKK